jgi:hypothetical protein
MRGSYSWFKKVFGFEESHQAVRDLFKLDNGCLVSLANDRRFAMGKFSTPCLMDLRSELVQLVSVSDLSDLSGFKYDHISIDGALELHHQYPSAVFQAASQFNCLEFPSSKAYPELGVEVYAMDMTQGPACALACPAGTVFRNYFVQVDSDSSDLGQSKDKQLNNLKDLGVALGNGHQKYWNVENGYVFSYGSDHLDRLNALLVSKTVDEVDQLRSLIRIGLQEDVGVTFRSRFIEVEDDLCVTQVYASALSCAYSGIANQHWEPLAKLVLEASYEATILAAAINFIRKHGLNQSRNVFLTFLGGGVFGNDQSWINDAIVRALRILQRLDIGLHVHICHFRRINTQVERDINYAFTNDEIVMTNDS